MLPTSLVATVYRWTTILNLQMIQALKLLKLWPLLRPAWRNMMRYFQIQMEKGSPKHQKPPLAGMNLTFWTGIILQTRGRLSGTELLIGSGIPTQIPFYQRTSSKKMMTTLRRIYHLCPHLGPRKMMLDVMMPYRLAEMQKQQVFKEATHLALTSTTP